MEVQVSGKNIELGDALRAHVSARLSDSVEKYFGRGAEAVVTFAKERHLVECEMTAHLFSGVFLAAHGSGGDAYAAFEEGLDKLEKRVRRYKRRLRNHHANAKSPLPAEDASAYVLAPLEEETEADGDASAGTEAAPLVIAESTVAVRTMTVSMAVMQLDLSKDPALLFRNAAHGGLSVVYRRSDGNIGWVDPNRDSAKATNGG